MVKHMVPAVLVALFVSVLGAPSASPESLWSPDFPGYLSRGSSLTTGDSVIVDLGTGFSLSFESATQESKHLNLEFSGGEFGELFSFLPSTRSNGTRNVAGGSDWTIQGRLAALVTAIDATGLVTVQGARTVSFDGKDDSVSVAGSFDIRDLTMDRSVPFSSLVDSTLVFTTVAESRDGTIAEADIQTILDEALVAADTPDGAAAPAGIGPPAGAQTTRYELPLERRRELLVRYVNRIVDILFSQP